MSRPNVLESDLLALVDRMAEAGLVVVRWECQHA